jgi:predicted CoA-substrate-specific enzyme activase
VSISVGIDIGTVSVKGAIVGDPEDRPALERLVDAGGFSFHPGSLPLLLSPYRRCLGKPVAVAISILAAVRDADLSLQSIRVTGAGAKLLQAHEAIERVNDVKAIAAAVAFLHPGVATVFEMGGESSRFLRLDASRAAGQSAILAYENNGDCAAGTGAFMDQQANRMRHSIEEVGAIACRAPSAARIAGRCSVFAKSDMIHAQQKGATPPQILRGLCDAVARNFKGSITKGNPVVPPVVFIGGVARNAGVVQALRELYRLDDGQFFVSPAAEWCGAVGAALLCRVPVAHEGTRPLRPAERLAPAGSHPATEHASRGDGATARPLSLQDVLLLRDRVRPPHVPATREGRQAYLGIDIGSVSTNLVVVDEAGDVLHEIYVRTEGRPIEVVREGLRTIALAVGDGLRIGGVGTTGSGRELIGELVGADTITNEITAHTTGAMHVARTLLGETVDTIFEIGGQDAKFIAIEDGVVVDFAMNEACAAGTGSFLEEQAERLGVAIKGEFSKLAFQSQSPVRLGERCTVFMEQDVNAWLQRGAPREDLVAGLAYSVALNYLHRVVRGRRIGRTIYFQGGTAYNDAVAAAFAGILNTRIIVPPHNGVIGAIGMALLAQEMVQGTGRPTTFRGFDLDPVRSSLREFVCRACSNLCDMQEFTVEGVKTYWGDKCSDKYRKRPRSERKPCIPDLMAQRRERLLEGYAGPAASGARVGIPQAMFFHDRFPFWRAFLEALGCVVILSDETNRKIAQDGIDLTVAEPCFPIRAAHGHVKDLLDKGVEWILLPNVMNAEPTPDTTESQMCPWAQTLPYVVKGVPRLAEIRERILAPTVHFRLGEAHVAQDLLSLGRTLGARPRQTSRAVAAGFAAQKHFQSALNELGRDALAALAGSGQPGIVLVGRAYNIHDRAINLDVPGKLRDYYGINVLPLDCLPLGEVDIRDVNANMYWHSGRRILAAAKLASASPNLHLIHITNFKCGPDSYIKHFLGPASGKPLLSLQFDGHGNDAGFLTRCEAYLDSKDMLRWWRHAPRTCEHGISTCRA